MKVIFVLVISLSCFINTLGQNIQYKVYPVANQTLNEDTQYLQFDLMKRFTKLADSMINATLPSFERESIKEFVSKNFDPITLSLDDNSNEVSLVRFFEKTDRGAVMHLFRYSDQTNELVSYATVSEEEINRHVRKLEVQNKKALRKYFAFRDSLIYDSIVTSTKDNDKLRRTKLEHLYEPRIKDSIRLADSNRAVIVLAKENKLRYISRESIEDSILNLTAKTWVIGKSKTGIGRTVLLKWINWETLINTARRRYQMFSKNDPLGVIVSKDFETKEKDAPVRITEVKSIEDAVRFIRYFRYNDLVRSNLRSALKSHRDSAYNPALRREFPVTVQFLFFLDQIHSLNYQLHPGKKVKDSIANRLHDLQTVISNSSKEQIEKEAQAWEMRSNRYFAPGKFIQTMKFYINRVASYLDYDCPTLVSNAGKARKAGEYEVAISTYGLAFQFCQDSSHYYSMKILVDSLTALKQMNAPVHPTALVDSSANGEEALGKIALQLNSFYVYLLKNLYVVNMHQKGNSLDSISIRTENGIVYVTLTKSRLTHSTIDYFPGSVDRDDLANQTQVIGLFIDTTRVAFSKYLNNRPILLTIEGYADAIPYNSKTVTGTEWIADSEEVIECESGQSYSFGQLRSSPDSDRKNLALAYARAKKFYDTYVEQWGDEARDEDDEAFRVKAPCHVKLCGKINAQKGGEYRGVTVTIVYDFSLVSNLFPEKE